MRLDDLFAELDRCERSVPIDLLCDRLSGCDTCLQDLGEFVRFGDDGYRRNLVHLGPGYAALLLCWRPGQQSPLHDHRGASCALRIMAGTATEVRYRYNGDRRLVEAGRNVYRTGQVCGTFDADIHTVRNDSPDGVDLITLHVYTPPMLSYHTYCLQTGNVVQCADHEVLAEMERRADGASAPLPGG